MAGAKGKSGGARKGAGRKAKFNEDELLEIIDEAWPKETRVQVFKRIADLALAGSAIHIRILLEFAYGKPKQILEITGDESRNQIPPDVKASLNKVYGEKSKDEQPAKTKK